MCKQLQLIEGKYVWSTPKNGTSRTVAVSSFVIDAFKKQRINQAEQKLAAGELWNNADDLVFTRADGTHMSRNTIYNNFKDVVDSIGIPDTRFHDLRHTFATISIANGDDTKTVQSQLGHATAAFTLNVYAHATSESKKSQRKTWTGSYRKSNDFYFFNFW